MNGYPALARQVQLIRSAGFKPRLLIQAYSNTQQSDVESVAEIGKKAGFEFVETEWLAWPDNLGGQAAESRPEDEGTNTDQH